MVIALLFFVVSFAVIIRIFAAADGIERQERRRERAELVAQSVAEAYSVSVDAGKAVELVLGISAEFSGGTAEIWLDDEMKASEQPEVMLTLTETQKHYGAGVYSRLVIDFTTDGEKLYSLECAAYAPQGGEAVG